MLSKPKGIRWAMRGAIMVEFSIVFPLLLLMMLGVFEYGRMIQYNNIVISLAREGANLSARTFTSDYQDIMDKLAVTATPLEMDRVGMIYITEIEGRADGQGQVRTHYRWGDGGFTAANSAVWTCITWRIDDSCIIPDPDTTASIAAIPMTLNSGELVYAVEVFYNYHMMFSGIFGVDSPDIKLSSMSVF